MSLIVGCSQCGKKYKLGDDKAGKKFKCGCGALVAVPFPDGVEEADPWEAADEVLEEEAAPPSRRPTPGRVPGQTGASRATKGAQSSGKTGLIVGLVIGGVLLLTLGGLGSWYFFFRKPGGMLGGGNPARPAMDGSGVLSYLPEDSSLVVVAQPAQAFSSRIVKEGLPPAMLNEIEKGGMPVDPRQIEQVAFFWTPPFPGVPEKLAEEMPLFNITVAVKFVSSTTAEQQVQKLPSFSSNFTPLSVPNGKAWLAKFADKEKSQIPADAIIALYSPSPQILLAGCKGRIMTLGQGSGNASMKALLSQADLSHELIIAGTKLNEFKMPQWTAKGAGPTALPVAMAGSMLSMYKQTLLQVGLSPNSKLIDLIAEARDEEVAKQLETQLGEGRKKLTEFSSSPMVSSNPGASQLLAEISSGWQVTRTGATVRLSIPHTSKINDAAIASLKPAAAQADRAANRTKSKNNMKQVGLAMHNYYESNNQMPPNADKEDPRYKLPTEKQVSWLYDILPFMEQLVAYNAIDRSKPWNDAKNKEAGATVVEQYLHPEMKPTPVDGFGVTHYVGLGGLGENGPNEPLASPKAGAFGYKRKTGFRDFRDGRSNTAIAVEAYGDHGPWIANGRPTIRAFTKQPYLHGPDGIGGPRKDGPTQFLLMDGSVRAVAPTIDPKTLEAITTPAGGEPTGDF